MFNKRLKNVTDEIIYICGTGIMPGDYYTIPINEYLDYLSDEELLKNIVLKKIVVNDGVKDLTNVNEAWNYLLCKTDSPKTSEGYTITFQKEEFELKNSQIFNLFLRKNLEEDFGSEGILNTYIFVPKNKIFKLTGLSVINLYSSMKINFEYHVKIHNDFYLFNPFLDSDLFYNFRSLKDHEMGGKEIDIKIDEFCEKSKVEEYINAVFVTNDERSNKRFFVVNNFNGEDMKLITTELNFVIKKDQKLTRVNRPVLSFMVNYDSFLINNNIPLKFFWEDDSYIKLEMKILEKNYPENVSHDIKNIELNIEGYTTTIL